MRISLFDDERRWRPWMLAAATVAGYAASVVIRRGLMTASPEAVIWLPAGMIAGLLLLPNRFRLGCLAACFVVNLICSAYFGLSPRTFLTFPLVPMVVYGVRPLLSSSLDLTDPRRLGLFLVGVAAPACALISLFQVAIPSGHPTDWAMVEHWFIGHVLGVAVLVPSLLVLARAQRFAAFQRSFGETFVALLTTAAFVAFLFWRQDRTGLALLIFPMAMFVAFRYGPVGVSVLSLILTGLAVANVYGYMPHLGPSALVTGQTEWVQLLVALVFLTSLPAAGVLAQVQRMRTLFERRTAMAKLARTRADQAAQAKGEFLANMSHEIRTPLNGVIGLADALSRTPLEASQRDMLKMILSSGQALRGLLSDALDLARAESGALVLAPEAFDVRQTIGGASYLFETLAHEKGLGFSVSFDLGTEREVIGDGLRIRQIVSNLISNAVKFTERGEVAIEVTVQERGPDHGRLCVTIQDTGRGFDDDTKARLFNRFEQGDNSVTRRYGGSGLGLSIVRQLANMMGGTVDCRSIPGVGSVFTFEVDMQLGAAAAANTRAKEEEVMVCAASGRMHLLLAEDHPINQKVIQAILGDQFDLTIVGDGQAAVHAFREQSFDAVLMDTHMPIMDGLTAIRAIRALEAAEGRLRTPIVSLTADALTEHVQEAARAGADRHLAKPVTTTALFGTLAALQKGQPVALGEAAACI